VTTAAPPSGRWSVFRVPLWLALVYIAVLGVVATFPTKRSSQLVGAQASVTPAPAQSRYTVCGIDRQADARTGHCVPVTTTPLPCVQGSNFDAKAGFCMPVAASPPPAPVATAPPADPFANFPGGIRKPEEPTMPFFGNNNGNSGNDTSQP
jgi:hypothetical protein